MKNAIIFIALFLLSCSPPTPETYKTYHIVPLNGEEFITSEYTNCSPKTRAPAFGERILEVVGEGFVIKCTNPNSERTIVVTDFYEIEE